jgi:replication factor C subunit 3/5
LKKLAKADDFPHLLFYGQNGAGKKTRVLAFLNEVYGSGIQKLKSEVKEFK